MKKYTLFLFVLFSLVFGFVSLFNINVNSASAKDAPLNASLQPALGIANSFFSPNLTAAQAAGTELAVVQVYSNSSVPSGTYGNLPDASDSLVPTNICHHPISINNAKWIAQRLSERGINGDFLTATSSRYVDGTIARTWGAYPVANRLGINAVDISATGERTVLMNKFTIPNWGYCLDVGYVSNYPNFIAKFTAFVNSHSYPPILANYQFGVTQSMVNLAERNGTTVSPIDSGTSLPAGCISTLGYSSTTGIKCETGHVSAALPDGCTSTSGFSATTGVRCDGSSTYVTPPTTQPSSITVLSPNGGEDWNFGQSQTVRWDSKSLTGNIDIYLYNLDSSGAICKVGSAPASSGNFIFTPVLNILCNSNTQFVPGQYRVKLIASGQSFTSGLGVYDISDSYLTITAPVSSTALTITSISPTSGPAGTPVTVNVSNYLDDPNNSLEFRNSRGGTSLSGRSTDGRTIRFNAPDYTYGTYEVQLNSDLNGTSNKVYFQLTAGNVLGTESFHFTQFMEEGSYGNEVMELQKFLNNAGYNVGNVDKTFGAKVKAALIQFQVANGLKGDGIVGFEVRSFLNK